MEEERQYNEIRRKEMRELGIREQKWETRRTLKKIHVRNRKEVRGI